MAHESPLARRKTRSKWSSGNSSPTRAWASSSTDTMKASNAAVSLQSRVKRAAASCRSSSKLGHHKTLDIDCVEGDLSDPKMLARAMEGCEIVYHCAATTNGPWTE